MPVPNVGLAFGLVFASGISTSIGALLSFAIKITDYHVLAVALGVSAGVMLFVSVVELYMTSALLAFSQGGVEARMGFIYATICLFIGMLAMKGLDMVVHLLLHLSKPGKKRSAHGGHSALAGSGDACCAHHDSQSKGPHRRQSHSDSAAAATAAAAVKPKYGIEEGEYGDEELQLLPAGSARRLSRVGRAAAGSGGGDNCGGGCDAPVAASGNGSAALRRSSMNGGSGGSGGGLLVHDSARSSNEPVLPLSSSSAAAADLDLEGAIARQLRGEDEEDEPEEVAALFKADDHLRHMTRMGLLSGLAVGLHNIPEGLATFVGTIAKPSSGLVIALAIALHNIPEGIVVAIPVYYATKSRLKSFLWASLSGFAEPLGAVLGYLLVSTNHLNPVVYAVVYGLVAGMMTYLALKELLPTALRYDPEDKYSTTSLLLGMAFMAISLMLFRYYGM